MRTTFFLGLLHVFVLVHGQNKTFNGYVRDAETGENLIGATIYDMVSKKGAVTNVYGFYSLTLNTDSVRLNISFVGYETQEFNKPIKANIETDFDLLYSEVLDAVTVVGEESIEGNPQMGLINVPVNQIKQVPMILGEVDVLKTLRLLPGVQGGSEGTSGIYVRGGGPDQNLILIDGVPVYNASHLLGFFSIFNADAINNVTLVKGGFPARYGGRLSSVIDISMKEGNNQKLGGKGSIGLLTSKFIIEGPIKNENTSFILSGRRTYLDLLARPFTAARGYPLKLFFGDLNAKINHRFSNKDRIYLSFYGGNDVFSLKEKVDGDELEYGIKWGNTITALRWNHLFSPKLFANVTGTFSRYHFNTFDMYNGDYAKYNSGIKDFAAKVDFDYLPTSSHNVKFGAMWIHHTFNPGIESQKVDGKSTKSGNPEINATELSAYVEDDITVNNWIRFNMGIHTSLFNVRKKTFNSIQPRFSGRFLIDQKSSIKVSYAMMRQFVQLITNSGGGLPSDLWVPATDKVLPQESWQVALGVSRKVGSFELSLECYYKEMNNLIEYKNGITPFDGSINDWEETVTRGKGDSYGIEFLVQRKVGRLSGWLGYTISKTTRQFDELNFGRRFPYKYDRRHDFSLVTIYELTDRIKLSGSWVYSTGYSTTIPNSEFQVFTGQYVQPSSYRNNTLQYLPTRNNYKVPSTHHLDVGISMSKEKPRGVRTWSFGAYNLYNRKNPFYVEIINNRFRKRSIFPIIPYVNYIFEF